MVRADRNRPDIYFGRPGYLFKLPYPKGGIDKPYDRSSFDFITGSGNHRVSQLLGGSRSFALTWNALHLDNYSVLERFWTGNMGIGPWAFIDPSQPNMLTVNQASATSQYNYWYPGWDTYAGNANFGTLSSNNNAAHIHRYGATRSLRWHFTVAPAVNPFMGPQAPWDGWHGFPVVPGLSYAFSAWLKPDGTLMTNPSIAMKMRWVNALGATLSEISGGDTFMTSWSRMSVVGVAPPSAAYCLPLIVGASNFVEGGSIYVDELVLEQDTVVNDWAPGTGLRPVEIMSLTDAVPFAARFRQGVTMSLREVV